MSGRDLRTFLSSHRSGTFHTSKTSSDSLGRKYTVGSAPKVQPVDYEQVLSNIQRHKDNVSTGLKRFKSISKKGKETKETSILRKHHEIWKKEHTRMIDLQSKVRSELNQWRADILAKDDPIFNELLMELTTFESELYEQSQQFRALTLTPVQSVRTELKSLFEERSEVDQLTPSPLELIMAELETVVEQQNKIQQLLQDEYEIVETDLEVFMDDWGICNHGNTLVVKEMEKVVRGVPLKVKYLECPDEKLRSEVLNEFSRLDEQFTSLLDEWRSTNESIINLPYGGWSRCNAERFCYLVEQYPPSLTNRRRLYMDRAVREFPYKRREEIVAHESWHHSLQHYLATRRTLLTSWTTHRGELADKVTSLFEEVRQSCQVNSLIMREREEWRQKCQRQYHKVRTWREEKVKVQQVEAAKIAKQQALEEEQRHRDELRQQKKRECEKHEIRQYHSDLESRRHANLEQVRRLGEVVKIEKKKQATLNMERIEYRHERLSEKIAEAKEAREVAEKETIEKERRLELLRQQVQVETTSDPERVLQATASTQARLTALTEPDLRQPLYQLHSYTSDKITSDPRVRVETALREAGLHTSHYARKILSKIPPPQRPRPDQASTLFKDTK